MKSRSSAIGTCRARRPELQTPPAHHPQALVGLGQGLLITGSSKLTGHGSPRPPQTTHPGIRRLVRSAWTRLTSKIPSWVASRFRAPMVGQECSPTAGAEQSGPDAANLDLSRHAWVGPIFLIGGGSMSDRPSVGSNPRLIRVARLMFRLAV